MTSTFSRAYRHMYYLFGFGDRKVLPLELKVGAIVIATGATHSSRAIQTGCSCVHCRYWYHIVMKEGRK